MLNIAASVILGFNCMFISLSLSIIHAINKVNLHSIYYLIIPTFIRSFIHYKPLFTRVPFFTVGRDSKVQRRREGHFRPNQSKSRRDRQERHQHQDEGRSEEEGAQGNHRNREATRQGRLQQN